jgi:phage shock protein E
MNNLKEIVKNGQNTLLDVRTNQEFNDGHFPGAINVPLQEIKQRLDEIDEMQKPIVVYCLSGGRSMAAVGLLKQSGVDEVYNGGGLADMQYLIS